MLLPYHYDDFGGLSDEEAVRDLCDRYPDEYWRDLARQLGAGLEWEPLLYARSRLVHAAEEKGDQEDEEGDPGPDREPRG